MHYEAEIDQRVAFWDQKVKIKVTEGHGGIKYIGNNTFVA